MNYYNKTFLELPSFETTNLPNTEIKNNVTVQTIYGRVTTYTLSNCPCCGGIMHIHSIEDVTLKHYAAHNILLKVNVSFYRYKCNRCNYTIAQNIPFKAKNHFITAEYARQLKGLIINGHMTNKAIAKVMHCNPTLVKDIDKKRLKAKYDNKIPNHNTRYIGLDEFLLHKNHQYATVVVYLETSEILFLEKGNKAQQLHNFFNKVGDKWMKHIKAIAMDMNAQYSNAVKDRYPDIDIVYDLFHICYL